MRGGKVFVDIEKRVRLEKKKKVKKTWNVFKMSPIFFNFFMIIQLKKQRTFQTLLYPSCHSRPIKIYWPMFRLSIFLCNKWFENALKPKQLVTEPFLKTMRSRKQSFSKTVLKMSVPWWLFEHWVNDTFTQNFNQNFPKLQDKENKYVLISDNNALSNSKIRLTANSFLFLNSNLFRSIRYVRFPYSHWALGSKSSSLLRRRRRTTSRWTMLKLSATKFQ